MASVKSSPEQQASAPYKYGMSGYLLKRQRGRRWSKGFVQTTKKEEMSLRFERRYCILKKEYFSYMANEKVGSFTEIKVYLSCHCEL